MIDSEQQQRMRARHRRSARLAKRTFAATLTLVALSAAVALASGATVTIGAASSSKLGEQITVNAQGRTLYTLSGETTRHLKCKSSECLKFWPPVTVPSRTTKLRAGAGVQGHLGILRRGNGVLQVTLRGLPMYRYSRDHAKGQVNGQGVESFGGTWHALPAASTTAPATPGTPSETPTTPTPGYEY